ncbi:hypothetical protein [Aureimonas leprariae]|uniref:Uncharacterized protein n=1 Tax=Plantimonas leprariae TaxID=2615207 RepID=A0A7V7TV45_9HYPH|nr:hypothetical protein [Aureimonas leprariae]KAB0676866.1 hypothetical protein F6X38_20050 [Aureimonas leprariae]
MSTIGTISGPSFVPSTPDETAKPQTAAAVTRVSSAAPDARLSALLDQIAGSSSGVGLAGLRPVSAPGDLAVLLAEASLALEKTNDAASGSRASLVLAKIVNAMQAYDPAAARALEQVETAAAATAKDKREEIAAERQPLEARVAEAEKSVESLKAEIRSLDAPIEAARKAVAALEGTKGHETDPAYLQAVKNLSTLTNRQSDLGKQLPGREAALAAAKADLAAYARQAAGEVGAILATEVGRLEKSDRRTATEATRQSMASDADGLGPTDAAGATKLLDKLGGVLTAKVAEYTAAANTAFSLARLLASLVTIAGTRVAAFASASFASETTVGLERGRDIDQLMSDLFEAAAEGDRSAAIADPAAAERRAGTEDDAAAVAAQRAATAVLAAATDLLGTLASLDPLVVQAPPVQPGRSRMRLEV